MAISLYPTIHIDHSKNPNRWYAIPFLGFLYKLIIVIPVSIELNILRLCVFLLSILNSIGIFSRGRYWKLAYQLNIGTMQLETNMSYFLFGLTDVYPGFSLTTTNYTFTLTMPKNPSRLFATPLLGVLARSVLMIPYLIYRHFVFMAAVLAVLVSWISVLFKGVYPETTYEIVRDSVRIDQAVNAYFLGLSDSYPSFWISLNHKSLKILLLGLAILFTLWTFWGNTGSTHRSPNYTHDPMIGNQKTLY